MKYSPATKPKERKKNTHKNRLLNGVIRGGWSAEKRKENILKKTLDIFSNQDEWKYFFFLVFPPLKRCTSRRIYKISKIVQFFNMKIYRYAYIHIVLYICKIPILNIIQLNRIELKIIFINLIKLKIKRNTKKDGFLLGIGTAIPNPM